MYLAQHQQAEQPHPTELSCCADCEPELFTAFASVGVDLQLIWKKIQVLPAFAHLRCAVLFHLCAGNYKPLQIWWSVGDVPSMTIGSQKITVKYNKNDKYREPHEKKDENK